MRVRRALILAIDQWHGAPALSKIANVQTVGGIVFPGSPLAATKEELQQMAGFWPDIEKSRAEARRLLKEAGAEGLTFELLNRNVDQPYKYRRHLAGRRVEQDRRQGDPEGGADRPVVRRHAQRQLRRRGGSQLPERRQPGARRGPDACRTRSIRENYGDYDDQKMIDIYNRMLQETDPAKHALLMRAVREAHSTTRRISWRCRAGTASFRRGPT